MPSKGDSKKFIHIVTQLMNRWGYSHTDGKVYAHLLLKDKPTTIAELAEETGLSRSSISTALSRLGRDYIVTYRKEGKTKYFSAVPAFLEKFLQQPREILEHDITPLEGIVKRFMEASPEGEDHFRAIMEDLQRLECVLKNVIELEERGMDCI
ncbi:GbsR/MarR family transcriptional regulator [Thermococcus sp.]|uniref:GbsR/MarR family transcriptional regulator n=1 Tax=Thermococcus sp. TaxID=35749 RepID=UPI00262B7419|nr:helix-turn-helix domain-containing protein [Thermococcus sp.]